MTACRGSEGSGSERRLIVCTYPVADSLLMVSDTVTAEGSHDDAEDRTRHDPRSLAGALDYSSQVGPLLR